MKNIEKIQQMSAEELARIFDGPKCDYCSHGENDEPCGNCVKFLCKGRLVAVNGAIQTGSYQNKGGNTVYTTDVVTNRVEFLEWGDKQDNRQEQTAMPDPAMPDSFEAVNEDLPF